MNIKEKQQIELDGKIQMTNDIIERLQNLSEAMINGMPLNDGDFLDIECAIDEIKKLRKHLGNEALDRIAKLDEEMGLNEF